MSERWIPVAGYLLVRVHPQEERTESGLWNPETSRARDITRATRGTVLALGFGVVEKLNGGDAHVRGPKDKVPIDVGSVIEFEMFAGNSWDEHVKKERLKVVSWEDVRAVVLKE